jgi:C-terminal processing protease CtpA/Prc
MFIDQSHLLRGTNRLPKKPPDKRIPEASRILSSSESKKDLADNLVQTLLKSKDFVTKLKTLAAHSGSSTEDSDQETAAIPSHVHKELMNHVHSLMAPMKMTLIDAVIERDGGFGFSVSDGLIEGGVYINQIQPDGPADKSGIQPFDKIVKVNGVNVKDYDCCKIKPLFTQTDKISMTVVRNPLALGDHQVATPTSQSNDVISSSQPIEEDDDPSRFIS